VKKLLGSVRRRLVVDPSVQVLVIVIINLVDDAGLRVSQVGENGPLANFEHFGFEARPQVLGLGVIVAVGGLSEPFARQGAF
jgi:hypothetical protein